MAIALSSNALTTLDTVKMMLEITDTLSDDYLTFKINTNSEFIANECKRVFGMSSYTEKYQGTGTNKLILDQYPVISVASVIDTEGLATTDYEIEDSSSILNAPVVWSSKKKYTVIYTAGYVLPQNDAVNTPRTLPYDLENACIELVSIAYQMKGSEHLKTEVIGPLRSEFLPGIPESVQKVINLYKDHFFV